MNPLDELIAITETLRGKNGCEWDKKQTHESMVGHIIEEAYEVVHAIESGDRAEHLKEELGDLLFQIVFQAQLSRENGKFNFYDICSAISEKLVRRHPHVFGEKMGLSPEEVKVQWEKIKEKEKESQKKKHILSEIPSTLPGFIYAEKLQERASHVGFDWENAQDVLPILFDEVRELQETVSNQDSIGIEEEIGDILFTLINFCRKKGLSAEQTLIRSSNKFRNRFNVMEKEILKLNKDLCSMPIQELEVYWENAKKKLRGI